MRIRNITIYQKQIALREPYFLSGGRLKFDQLDSTFIKMETECGLVGWGEGCPWGHTYLPAHGDGIRAAAKLLCPALVGMDPRRIEHINTVMDLTLPGHLYAKSPLDMACWDIFGQYARLPIADLLGGCYPEPTPIASSISTGSPKQMLASIQRYRDRGYHVHSVKVGANVELDIERILYLEKNRNPDERFIYDVNRAWLPAEAIQVMNSIRNSPLIFEQPCETLEECTRVHMRTTHLVSIDERLETLGDLQQIIHGNTAEIINIKLGRVGGLSRARKLRDLAVYNGLKCLIMDTGGTVIADTAAQHLAQTLPSQFRLATWLCQEMLEFDPAPKLGSRNSNGLSHIPDHTIGLGVAPDESKLGKAIAVYQHTPNAVLI